MRKGAAILALAVIASTGIVGVTSALGETKVPSTYFACVDSQHRIVDISTSTKLVCGRETKVSWNMKGATGPRGAVGHPGAKGAVGPAGITGLKGATGPAGAIGLTGSIGPAGAVGPRGAAGPAGATGPAGAIGPAGATGAAGATVNCSIAPSVGSDFADCNLGTVFWFGVNYDGSNFSGVNFSVGTHIYDSSSMVNADFSGASLSGASLYSSANFTNANFTGTDLSNTYLYAGGNFTNANFSGANLTGAYLYAGGNFTNANFSGANLTGAFLSESTLSSAIWNNTTCPGGTNSSLYSPQTCVGH